MATNATATVANSHLSRELSNKSDSLKLKSQIVQPPSSASHQAGRTHDSTFAEAKEVVSGLRQIQTDTEATQALSLDAVLMEYHEAANNADEGSNHSSHQGMHESASSKHKGVSADSCVSCGRTAPAAKAALFAFARRAPRWLALELYAYFILMLPYITILSQSDDDKPSHVGNGTAEPAIYYTREQLMLRPAYALGVARVASHGLKLAYVKVLYRILPVTVSHHLQCFLGWPLSVLLWIPGMVACISSRRVDSEPW